MTYTKISQEKIQQTSPEFVLQILQFLRNFDLNIRCSYPFMTLKTFTYGRETREYLVEFIFVEILLVIKFLKGSLKKDYPVTTIKLK